MDRIEEISPELSEKAEEPDDRSSNRSIENRTPSGQPDADTEIFNQFLAGSDVAFRKLYDTFERPLYLYVVRLVGSSTDAEDVFQEIWTRMYRLRGEKKEVKRFSGLLFTIARNLAINMIRDRKVLPDTSVDNLPFDAEAILRTNDVEVADIRDMIERALMQLPIAQREAFILREYNGYSYQEIAEIMGTPMVTAKTRAWRGRERLRKMIAAWMGLKEQG
jgi:RNA polymerase sigma-70 factor (ECF subfamily)